MLAGRMTQGWHGKAGPPHTRLCSDPAINVVMGLNTQSNRGVFNFHTITVLLNPNLMCFRNP